MSSWESPLLDAGPFGVSERRFVAPPVGLYIPPTARLSRYSTTQCIYGPEPGSDAAFDVKQYDLGERESVLWWRGKRLALDMNPSRIAGMTNPRKFTLNTGDKLLNIDGKEGASAMAASTLYYVYLNPDGVIRASATAPSFSWQGVRTLGFNSTGGLDWLFIGYVRTNASTQFVDTVTDRLVINWFNRIRLSLYRVPGYVDDNLQTTYTTASATWVQANGGTDSTVTFVANGLDACTYVVHGTFTASDVFTPRVGCGEDSTTAAKVGKTVTIPGVSYTAGASVGRTFIPAEGYRTLDLLIASQATFTVSVIADITRVGAAADPAATYIHAVVMG